MIELIMASFLEMLESEDWLSDQTKRMAKEKVKL